MKKVLLVIIGLGVVIVAGATPLQPEELRALTPIDTVPTPNQLDTKVWASAQDALSHLTAIAQDTSPDADPGARLRAIHALGKYCPLPPTSPTQPCTKTDPGWAAHQALHAVIIATQDVRSGTDLLVLRAAIEALGPQRAVEPQDEEDDEPLLEQLLGHPSRDIRTAAARALRDLCNTKAITSLQTRYTQETTDQVRLAISEALRSLPCPVN